MSWFALRLYLQILNVNYLFPMDEAAALLYAKQIVDELLESSSSSNDEEDDEIFAALLQPNSLAVSNDFVENIIQQYTDLEVSFRLRRVHTDSSCVITRVSVFLSLRII